MAIVQYGRVAICALRIFIYAYVLGKIGKGKLMEFSDEQLECGNEWLEGGKGMVIMNGVIVESIVADSVGNLFFISVYYAGTYGTDTVKTYAAWHYDKRIGELNTIISDVSYSDCVAAIGKFREGRRV